MDDQTDTDMLDGGTFAGRLDDIEARLERRAAEPLPAGLTDADAGSGERWEAVQVWAHMAEFIGYWQDEFESVIARYAGEPVPFGRTKRDPARIAAIEVGRHAPVEQLIRRTVDSLPSVRRRIAELGAPEWNAVGRHETLGDMDVEAIVERFVVSHLEEHLDQLDGLVGDGTQRAAG